MFDSSLDSDFVRRDRIRNKLLLSYLCISMLLILVFTIAFRGPVDNDYLEYHRFYLESSSLYEIFFGNASLLRNSDHIYFFGISLFKSFDAGFITFLLFTTFFSIFTKYLAIRKDASVTFSFLALTLWMSLNIFTYEAMQTRYALAMGFWFLALRTENKYTSLLLSILGSGIHNATLLLYTLIFFRNRCINHRRIILNTLIIASVFIIGRMIDFYIIPEMIGKVTNNDTIQYLSGKLVGYLNAQDNTLSLVTLTRLFILYLIYVLSTVYARVEHVKILNLVFFSFLLVSGFSGFSVIFGRFIPVVEFFTILCFFSIVAPRIKPNFLFAYSMLITSSIVTLVLFVLAIKLGNFSFK